MKKKKHLIFLAVIVGLVFALPQTAFCWLDGWEYQREITLDNFTIEDSFQVKVELTSANFDYSHAQTNGEDIRFTDNTDNLQDFWIEEWNASGTSTIWVEIATSGTSTFNLYYGNTLASSMSNGDATFVFFDDFNVGSEPDSWDKYSGNPVLSEYTGGARFDDGYVYRQQVIKNGTNDYFMYYCGGHDAIVPGRDNIGLATSADLINWTKYDGNQSEDAIISSGNSGDFDYDRAWGPGTVIRENATSWKMWYTGDSYLYSPHVCRIGYATSTDGYNWIKYNGSEYGGAIFDDMDGATAGGRGAGIPVVLKESDTDYKMWYHIYQNHKIKYATSSDGINWTIQNSGNAVITSEYSSTDVIKIDDTYYLWTQANSPYNNIKVFTSTNGIDWTDQGTQITTTNGGWDALRTYWGRIFEDTPGHWYMFYTGMQTAVEDDCRIGFAELEKTIPVIGNSQTGLDTLKWSLNTTGTGNIGITNQELIASNGSTSAGNHAAVGSVAQFSRPIIMEADVVYSGFSTSRHYPGIGFYTDNNIAVRPSVASGRQWFSTNDSLQFGVARYTGGVYMKTNRLEGSYHVKCVWTATQCDLFVDGISEGTVTDTLEIPDMSLSVCAGTRSHPANSSGWGGDQTFDDIFVRKYTSPEPGTAVGEETHQVSIDYLMPDADILTLKLDQNFPNPFKPETTISYSLPKSGNTELKIYNIKGEIIETIVNEVQTAGIHSIAWNAENVSSGIYLYRITFCDCSATKKFVILK